MSTLTAKRLTLLQETPDNGEPALAELVKAAVTPDELFYLRSHAPPPTIDPVAFQLVIDGLVERPITLTLSELQSRFPKARLEATLTCAGNRRSELSRVRNIDGVQWGSGATGHGIWDGVWLRDVLGFCGLRPEARHVWFEGLDRYQTDGRNHGFGASIPLAMLGRGNEPGTILATAMNGRPLAPDHGRPLRSLVPGFIGARSVKWLHRIHVSERPSDNHFMEQDYKIIPEPGAWDAAAPIEAFVLNSIICEPGEGANLPAGPIRIRGYALPTGLPGVVVEKVEITNDGGRSWIPATFLDPARPFCWRRWEAALVLPPGRHTLRVRAGDSSGATQPQTMPWNARGYLYNAWHEVNFDVNGKS